MGIRFILKTGMFTLCALALVESGAFAKDSAQKLPAHKELFECADVLEQLSDPSDPVARNQYYRFEGTRLGNDGYWNVTATGAYFLPDPKKKTVFLYLEDNGAANGTPVRPLHCKAHQNVSGCKDEDYDYAVTDGIGKFSNKSYQDQAKINCEDVVVRRVSPIHAAQPQIEGGGSFCDRSPDEPECKAGRKTSLHFKKCNQMTVLDNDINENKKDEKSPYKMAMLDSLKASAKTNISTYNKAFFATDRFGDRRISNHFEPGVRAKLSSCAKINVLSQAEFNQILTSPDRGEVVAEKSATSPGRGGHRGYSGESVR